ncbi:MAG: class I SAM-dependent methyltransferase [Candidatus Omnitrophica bacterium]|nr:class I SAM-dependent methyltransferase [Candidatus Omnitrophota bacterium]
MKEEINIPSKFTTRVFFMQHIAPYSYVRKFSVDKLVLDAGTSTGYGAFYLSQVAKLSVGMDINPEAICEAQKNYFRDNLKYLTGNVLEMQFPNEHFDIIISSQVVEHIELDKLDTYLSEIYRVLKKDGIFFVNTLNLLRNLKGRSIEDYDKNPHHVKEFRSEELREFLLRRFPRVEILGSRRGLRHNVYHLFKKSGIFKNAPDSLNPLKRFYENKISVDDFRYSSSNLDKSIDLLGVCRK